MCLVPGVKNICIYIFIFFVQHGAASQWSSVHRFNQHLTGPYYIQIFHKAQPTHSYMAKMLVIMDVRYDICMICMRYVAYSLWKVRYEVKVVHDLAIETLVGYK